MEASEHVKRLFQPLWQLFSHPERGRRSRPRGPRDDTLKLIAKLAASLYAGVPIAKAAPDLGVGQMKASRLVREYPNHSREACRSAGLIEDIWLPEFGRMHLHLRIRLAKAARIVVAVAELKVKQGNGALRDVSHARRVCVDRQ